MIVPYPQPAFDVSATNTGRSTLGPCSKPFSVTSLLSSKLNSLKQLFGLFFQSFYSGLFRICEIRLRIERY